MSFKPTILYFGVIYSHLIENWYPYIKSYIFINNNIKVGKETYVTYLYADKNVIHRVDIVSDHLNVAASLASTVKTVNNVFHCLGVRMAFATIHLSVSVLRDGEVSFAMNVCISFFLNSIHVVFFSNNFNLHFIVHNNGYKY